MADYNSLVPVIAKTAVSISGGISSLITRTKATGVIQHAQLEMLIIQTEKVLTDMRACLAGDIVTTNLEQLAKTQEHIDNLAKQGKLHGKSLDMAMDQLGDLNDTLRRNLRDFENRKLR